MTTVKHLFLLSPPTGSPLRLSSYCNAFLHLCHNWNAGMLPVKITFKKVIYCLFFWDVFLYVETFKVAIIEANN